MDFATLLGSVATQGLLGTLLVLSLLANAYLINKIFTLNELRVADAKELTTKFTATLDLIKLNGELLISLFQKFLAGTNGK